MDDDLRYDFGVVQAATLTLLGLIIGFSFSMATGRYDLRKGYEESEANAIGTEYVRADLLPPEEGARMKSLLREYTAQRLRFYSSRNWDDIDQIRTDTGKMQDELWTAASATANATAYAFTSPGGVGHERRAELGGIYAGCVVESDSGGGVVPDVCDCSAL